LLQNLSSIIGLAVPICVSKTNQKAILAFLPTILRTLQIRSGQTSQHWIQPLLPSSVSGCYTHSCV